MNLPSLSQKIAFPESYTFDDLLLLPDYADFTRDDVDLSSNLTPEITLKLPLISSPMDTVTMSEMAIHLAKNGGLGVIHRNLSIQDQAAEVGKVKNFEIAENEKDLASLDLKNRLQVAAAVGIGADMQERVAKLVEAEVDLLIVDSAHGHSKGIIEAVKFIKATYPNTPIMAGSIATYEGALALIEAGADILRVGIGPGSICTTRIVTGMGVPQLTAVSEVCRAAKPAGVKVVADGGIKQIGDMSKALAVGADCVMLGSMLAGYDESPGQLIEVNDRKYKTYRGMGSIGAMQAGSNSRYGQGLDPKKMVAEGIEALVPYKGEVDNFLSQIQGGLRGSFFYTGSRNMLDFHQKTRFVKLTGAGLKESHPHSVSIRDAGASYFGG
jgi:IMP dehydrogenase